MKNLRRNFERFCYTNRSKGIPNLMLYLCIGTAVVYVMGLVDKSDTLFNVLCFDRSLILQGQVWRLFTYVFAYDTGSVITTAISLLCYFSLGRALEGSWGTLRFNLYYLTGVVLMDIFSMVFGTWATVSYLNLSLFLAYATSYPDTRFLLFFVIPIKAWVLALFNLALTVFDVVFYSVLGLFPYNLFPLIALANYFLFFGKGVVNVVPRSWRIRLGGLFRKKGSQPKKTGTIPFPGAQGSPRSGAGTSYTHKCTVCGRTDVTNPELEFRYCSRCRGYYCYCQDHISSHAHIE